MKKINFIFLLLGYWSFSQVNGYVEYQYIKNLGIDYKTIGILNFNNTNSYFVELSPNMASKVESKSDEELIVTSYSKNRPIVYIDLKTDTLIATQELFRKTYITKEKSPVIKWVIKDRYKTIDKYSCQLAEGDFRGRKYNVWFTNDIPVKFGPWKLQGLPGLILEAIDEKNELIFNVRKISIVSDRKIETLDNTNAIELKEFINLKEKIYREKEKSMSSKLPRNSTFELNLPDRNTQPEIIYEWEVKEEKKD